MKKGGKNWKLLGFVFLLVMYSGFTVMPAAAQDKVYVGVSVPLSGPYSATGLEYIDGINYAIEEAGGKILGKPLEAVTIDDENKPGVAARKVQEAIQAKGIKYFACGVSSGTAMAISQVANEQKALFITAAAADEITGKQCNRSTFRYIVPVYGAVRETVIPLIKKFPGQKKWYTITADYLFGHSLLENVKTVFKEFGVEHVGNDMHPIGHTEFSSFLTKAMAAKADFIILVSYGQDSVNALKQAYNFGMTKKVKFLVPISDGLRSVIETGVENCAGVYFGAQVWENDQANPLIRKLNNAWNEKYKKRPFLTHMYSYLMVKMYLLGMEKAGTTNPEAVIKAMEGMKFQGLTGNEEIRAFDHQVIKKFFLIQAKEKKDIKGPQDYLNLISSGISFPSQAESECKMK